MRNSGNISLFISLTSRRETPIEHTGITDGKRIFTEFLCVPCILWLKKSNLNTVNPDYSIDIPYAAIFRQSRPDYPFDRGIDNNPCD
jgi:hypothetical protein